MSLSGYEIAFELATSERSELRNEIERLLKRGEMLDKLLECLTPFVSNPASAGEAHAAQDPSTEHQVEQKEHQEHPQG